MGFNIFLFLWLITNYLLPVLGISCLVLRRKLLNMSSPGPSTEGILLMNSRFPWFLEPPVIVTHPDTPFSAGLTGWYFPNSYLKCATSSHVCTYRLDTRTVNLSFCTDFFLSCLSDADNKLYSCLLIEKSPGVWRLHYKYSDWSTCINNVTFRLTSLVLNCYHTKCSS